MNNAAKWPGHDFNHLLQGRTHWHASGTVIKPEDTEALLAFCDVYFPRTDWDAYESFFLSMADKVLQNIEHYGDDGFGNKDPAMNRVQYWAAHIDSKLIAEAVATLSVRPVEDVVFEADKPPSSAPKCKVCKGKIAKGSLGIKKRTVRSDVNPVHDKTPKWKVLTKTIVCGNAACRAALSFAATPLLDGVSEARRVEAEALASEAAAGATVSSA